MQLARSMKRNPRELAQLLLSEIPPSPFVAKSEIAGAGFINFHLLPSAKLEVVRSILEQREAFGRSSQAASAKSRSSLYRPTQQDHCMLDMGAERHMAPACPACWLTPVGMPSPANTTLMMLAARWTSWHFRLDPLSRAVRRNTRSPS